VLHKTPYVATSGHTQEACCTWTQPATRALSGPGIASPETARSVPAHGWHRLPGWATTSRTRSSIDDSVVADWLAGGKRNGTIPALRAMFNDAASAKGGRLVRQNPFAGLRVSRGPGRRHEQPPSEEQVWKLIRCAHELASPSFAAWLQVAAFTGLRPGELDALRRTNVDLDRGRIRVVEQFNAKTRTFTPPKNGLSREAPLTVPAREAIVGLPVEGEFCFPPIQGEHWSAGSRAYHWKAIRGVAGWQGTLYLATHTRPSTIRLRPADLPDGPIHTVGSVRAGEHNVPHGDPCCRLRGLLLRGCVGEFAVAAAARRWRDRGHRLLRRVRFARRSARARRSAHLLDRPHGERFRRRAAGRKEG